MVTIYFIDDDEGVVTSLDIPKHHANDNDIIDVYDIHSSWSFNKSDIVQELIDMEYVERNPSKKNVATRAWYRRMKAS